MRAIACTCKFIVFPMVIVGLSWHKRHKHLNIKTLSTGCMDQAVGQSRGFTRSVVQGVMSSSRWFLCQIRKAGPQWHSWSCFANLAIVTTSPSLHKIRYTMAGLTLWELGRILGMEPGDVFRCSVHLISRQVMLPPQ